MQEKLLMTVVFSLTSDAILVISIPMQLMTTPKVLLGEEKVWEHIDALRTIVGYKAAPQATYIDELKALHIFALHIFTRVEPPASFRNPSDLAEVNDKFQFLMSIVGVK